MIGIKYIFRGLSEHRHILRVSELCGSNYTERSCCCSCCCSLAKRDQRLTEELEKTVEEERLATILLQHISPMYKKVMVLF